MAVAAVSFLLENLSQLLDSNADFIFGAEIELRKLEREVVSFRAILEEAAMREEDDDLRGIERQTREFVYDAEDTIDSSMSISASGNKSFPLSPNLKLAQDLRSLREDKVKPLLDLAASLQLGNGSGNTYEGQDSWKLVNMRRCPILTLILKPLFDFVAPLQNGNGFYKTSEGQDSRKLVTKAPEVSNGGFDDEVSVLVGYLVSDEPGTKHDVVSIVGRRGMGKTILAWEIFNSKKIEYEYPTRIWLNMSQGLGPMEHLRRIAKAFTSREVSSMSRPELSKMVRGYLKQEKLLFVLDDVWHVDAWNHIRAALKCSSDMSKVLITSEDYKVGKHANPSRTPHTLRLLSKNESWKLLQLLVFGDDEKCPKELELIGKEIVSRCHRSVSAIQLIGGILAYQCSMPVNNENINAWNKVSKLLSDMSSFNPDGDMPRIISLAYNKLPKDLRVCFHYSALFPQYYEIPTSTLIRLWIAEGFIRHDKGRTLEEAAEDNLKNLINRNLLTVCKRNSLGQVKTCRLHHLVSECCDLKAGIWEDDLFQNIMFTDGCFHPPVSKVQEIRRIFIQNYLPEFLSVAASEKIYSPRTRSLLCFNKGSVPPDYVSTIPTTFKLLRVLESKSIRFSRFPMKLSKLIHLKYITLSYENLNVLPEPMSALRNLQTLVLDTASPTLEVRADNWRMTQLRHLKTKASMVLAIQGVAEGNGGQNLQTMSRLSPENCTIQVFNRVTNLKRLGIRGKLATFLNGTSSCRLERLNRLVDLKLMNDLFTTEPQSTDRLIKLPRLDFFPPFLKRLTLSATYLDWTDMSVLGKINTLEALKLKNNAFTGMCWKAHGYGFSRLRFLLIAKADFVHWQGASSGCFRSLTQLVLKNCHNLLEIPVCLAGSLTVLDIEHLNKSAVESARKIKEEGDSLKLILGPGCG